MELLFRPEGVRRREHVLLIIKNNHGERSYGYVGLNLKCASFLVLSAFKQNLNLSTLISKNPQIGNLKRKMCLMAVALIQAEGGGEHKHDEARSRFSHLFCESAL